MGRVISGVTAKAATPAWMMRRLERCGLRPGNVHSADGWKDVLVFEEGIPPDARQHLLQALEDNTIVRASIFLLGKGVLLSLGDIPPGGATVSLLGREPGRRSSAPRTRTRMPGAKRSCPSVTTVSPARLGRRGA